MSEKTISTQYKLNNMETFAELVRAWDLDFRQLDCGKFQVDLFQVFFKNLQFSHTRLNRKINQQGSPPKTHWTFSIFDDLAGPFKHQGNELSPNDIMVFSPGSEIDCLSENGFSMFTFAISENDIDSVSRTMGIPEVMDSIKHSDRITCKPFEIQRLRQHLNRFSTALRSSELKFKDCLISPELEFNIPKRLFETLITGHKRKNNPPSKLRNYALRHALECIEMSTGENITVQGLCNVSGVSVRTLEYAFLEHFGITPKVYIRGFRLHCVRKKLIQGESSNIKISEVANHFGFWHMGQFARDYKNIFHELPSETLKKY